MVVLFFFLIQLFLIAFLFLIISNFSFFYFFFPTNDTIFIFFILTVFLVLSVKYITNPIYILLNIVFGFVLLSFLLFNQKCELLTYTFIIVYLGALMLLFLFIVMLLNIQNIKKNNKTNNEHFLFILLFFSFFAFILKFIIFTLPNAIILQEFTSIFFMNEITCNDMSLLILFQKPMISLFILVTILLLFVLVSSITTINAIKNLKSNNK